MPGPSRINGQPQGGYQSSQTEKVDKSVQAGNRKVSNASVNTTHLPKTKGEATDYTRLKNRKITRHQSDSLNQNQLKTARKLVNGSKWQAVESWLKINVTTLDQLHQFINHTKVAAAESAELQNLVASQFSALAPQELAKHLLATSDEQSAASQLETLQAIFTPRITASSPLGATARLKVDEFNQQYDHMCTQHRQAMISRLEQQVFALAALKMDTLENQLLMETEEQEELANHINQARTERLIIQKYQNDQIKQKA